MFFSPLFRSLRAPAIAPGLLALGGLLCLLAVPGSSQTAGVRGYYRFPALRGSTVVFTAHGDLWKVDAAGGSAQALTGHTGEEARAAVSPDGTRVAFSATYEGPQEVYVMPLSGGLPKRLTYDGSRARVVGWTPDGKVLYTTDHWSTLPDWQLVTVDPETRTRTRIPLSQASDGCYDPSGKTLFFTRQAFQGSHTRRYQGGTAQQLWKLDAGAPEAVPLTKDYDGTSKGPMWWDGRVYFLSDRDGTMNLWSMKPDGSDPKQHTRHADFEIQSASLDGGRVVYQLGADLHLFDLASGQDRLLDVSIVSDLDQMREKWVQKPIDYLTTASLSPNGDRVALTARGQVFVAPAKQGRLVQVTRGAKVRYRYAQFEPDGKSVLAVSDETGETEWWRLPANGVGPSKQVTQGATVLSTGGQVSPDGKKLAFMNKDHELWLQDLDGGKATRIAASQDGGIDDVAWSPDSRWLAYVEPTETFSRIVLYSLRDGKATPVTSDRYDNYSPTWSPEGKWLYFLSDRNLESLVRSPWGPRQPEPFFDRQTKLYQVSLRKGQRSPFTPDDEVTAAKSDDKSDEKKDDKKESEKDAKPEVRIDLEGIAGRLWELPVPAGNYSSLAVTGSHLLYLSRERGGRGGATLTTLQIDNDDPKPKAALTNVAWYTMSEDRKKLLVRQGDTLYVTEAGGSPTLTDKSVDLSGWSFSIDPREEWRQMFVEAWRLERDYFYDRKLHGADWPAVLKQYLPLVDRVTDRDELSDLTAQMVAELSALHIYVSGGDRRRGSDQLRPASLGANLERDEAAGGYRVNRIFRHDPDFPENAAPLARPGVDIGEGDVITMINGVEALSAPDPSALLRNQAGRQVLLRVRPKGEKKTRDVVVKPITGSRFEDLRYDDWELSRREIVEKQSDRQIGYVHLRAMGSDDIAQWAREYFPAFNRQGLIIDVRHNGGGNIDSWILEKLLRRAWFYWQPRVGRPYWNMQYAFRGHVTVVCDEWTASDGEAFTEGFRRLGLGKVIGTRTWGGEIWLTMSNYLVDRGIASAAEIGVYGPEGTWLIEGRGVEPDIVVDNLPHATFKGEDAQLQAAIDHLQKLIKEKPVPPPTTPPFPVKSRRPALPMEMK